MSVNNLGTFLNIKDSHLRVVSGNVYAQGINIGGITVDVAHGLQSITNQGNVTTNTLQFDNATTAFTTTANATVGRDLTVTGNATVSSNLTVTGNAVVSDDLTVTGNAIISDDLTVTGNTFYTNPAAVLVDSNVVTEYTGPHDRPLRKYPEVALTSASQSGYIVTPSTQNGSSVAAYYMFDGDRSTRWRPNANNDVYDISSPFLYNGSRSSSISDTSGTTHDGVFLKLELPKAIKLDYTVIRENSSPVGGTPGKITFLGSTNGTDWTFLKEFSGMSSTALDETYAINETNYYNHFAFVVKNLSDARGELDLGEWELYGHEEGSGSLDTTLKSVYNVPATTGTQLEVYYDGRETSSYSGSGTTVNDLSGNGVTGTLTAQGGFENVDNIKAFTSSGSTTHALTATTSLSGSPVMTISAWVKFDSFAQTSIIYLIGNAGLNNEMVWLGTQSNGSIWTLANGGAGAYNKYSNDTQVLNSWIHVAAIYSGGTYPEGLSLYINGILLTPTVRNGSGVSLTLPSNSPLYLGFYNSGTEFFDGSIANFRLYSKALNAGQIKELYDYQKDYFLGSKSQVTLYKGHLGVGVTEPSGQLELAGDERIQEYPPGPMSDYETYIPGHGVFYVYAGETDYSDSPHFFQAWEAFNDSTDSYHANNASYNGTDYAYSGNVKLTGQSTLGNYMVLELPYKIKVHSVSLGSGGTRSPEDFKIVGSNDGLNWTTIKSFSGQVYSSETNFLLNSTEYFSQLAMIVTKIQNDSTWEYTTHRYFGTPGPTTLDKGSLSLTRSLDVPRISRYDVDTETPRPEKLLVDFDTTVNSSPTDISGKGNHGTFNGGAYYSAADKAFVFDGTDDLIRSTVQVTADFAHSVSVWINVDSVGENTFFSLGNETTVGTDLVLKSSTVYTTASGFSFVFYGGDMTIPFSYSTGRWYHIVATRDTGGTFPNTQKFYIDGVDYSASASWSNPTSTTLALPTTATLLIGKILWATSAGFDGQISNFKLYDTVLTAEEVKTLYDMGRTGSVANPQPLHIAAPLYSPGTIVQVEQAVKTDVTTIGSTTAENIAGLSVTINPKFSTSKVLVSYYLNVGGQGHGFVRIKRTQGGTTSYIGLGDVSGDLVATTSYFYRESTLTQRKAMETFSFEFLDSANGTSAITYDIMCWKKADVFAMHINKADNEDTTSYYGRTSSSITVKEVCQ
jgi:carbonic anhydrase/acetyltransferase-like protein (isoleucine patch superfamily)